MAEGFASHEKAEVTARLAGPFQPRWPRAQQPRRGERLIARDDDVVRSRQQEDRHPHLGEIDPAAERDEAALGDQVLPKYLIGHFEVVGPRQIQRCTIPALETIQQHPRLVRSIAEIPLQHGFHVMLTEWKIPEPEHVFATDEAVASLYHLLESLLGNCGHHLREF